MRLVLASSWSVTWKMILDLLFMQFREDKRLKYEADNVFSDVGMVVSFL